MAVPPCRSYFFELTHSISPLTVSESRGYFLFFSIANPRRRVNARGRPSVSKKPRRVCRPQAAKHCNHFLSRHVRERKYFSGCKCGICVQPAHKLCAQQTASPLSEKPGEFFRQAQKARWQTANGLFHIWIYSTFMRLNAMIRPANTMETVEQSLMRMFRDGPEVSLNGSPTVSPTTAALCWGLPLPP